MDVVAMAKIAELELVPVPKVAVSKVTAGRNEAVSDHSVIFSPDNAVPRPKNTVLGAV